MGKCTGYVELWPNLIWGHEDFHENLHSLRTVDIHTLSKQMGNSAAMIERHYSKLTATMAA